VDPKLFRKTFLYICTNCNEFAHTKFDYCDKCGTEGALREAIKEDYKNYNNSK